MSRALLPSAGLRWWSETELIHRDLAVATIQRELAHNLRAVNPAWSFRRTEAPMLVPQSMISPAYDSDDVFFVQQRMMDEQMVLRPETTEGTYRRITEMLHKSQKLLPCCVWQVGKSFRVEASDGASAGRLRYNEFTQAEWQCVYRADTKADYRAAVLPRLEAAIGWLTGTRTRVVPSDRTPAYSLETIDVEVARSRRDQHNKVIGDASIAWTEMCSVSIRKDYSHPKVPHELLVLEVAVGVDRVVDVAGEQGVIE